MEKHLAILQSLKGDLKSFVRGADSAFGAHIGVIGTVPGTSG